MFVSCASPACSISLRFLYLSHTCLTLVLCSYLSHTCRILVSCVSHTCLIHVSYLSHTCLMRIPHLSHTWHILVSHLFHTLLTVLLEDCVAGTVRGLPILTQLHPEQSQSQSRCDVRPDTARDSGFSVEAKRSVRRSFECRWGSGHAL